MTTHKVLVVRVMNDIAYADDERIDKERLIAFSFGKIKGYKGQTAKELNLRAGRQVILQYDSTNKVNSVELA